MKTFIVATDFSPSADNALAYAARLAVHLGAKIVLYHAINLPMVTPDGMMSPPAIHEMVRQCQARLDKMVLDIANVYGVPVTTLCSTNLLLEELDSLCQKCEEPLVVMGMHGYSLGNLLFGSVTTSVLRRGKYPLLVVPADARYHDIAKILFACDYNSLSILHQFAILQNIALTYKAQIQFLHITKTTELVSVTDGSETRKGTKLEKIFRGIKHSYLELQEEDVAAGIEKGIENYHADMLVMMPHKLDFWDYLLNRSFTRNMAFRSRIPLLALPNRFL